MNAQELTQAAYAVLARMPEANVLSVHLSRDYDFGPTGHARSVEVASVQVHAKNWVNAQKIAEVFGLGEVEGYIYGDPSDGYGRSQYRVWRGWVTDGFGLVPVSVQVKGSEYIDAEDFDPSEHAPFVPAAPVASAAAVA
ncbi:hypothetical protein WBG06_11250 [Nocardioides sp. CCNWLW239]|uniref:hypothetical protein n=1 Tax=Nocardioides sp. CCNWLW239 TaxID=3128902 RepID=UPI0030162DF7